MGWVDRYTAAQPSPNTAVPEPDSFWDKLGNYALHDSIPAQFARNALSAVTLPHDVYNGSIAPDDPSYNERVNNLAGLVTGGTYATAPEVQNGLGMGIRAYHGSPHSFDQFDLSKIGTGEGAQSYGHGMYFAGNEDVAREYRDALSTRGKDWTRLAQEATKTATGADIDENSAMALLMMANSGRGTSAEAARWAMNRADELRAYNLDDIARAIDSIRSPENTGHMYQVDINADPSHLLDWDKPIVQQSNHIQSIMEKVAPAEQTTASNFVKRSRGISAKELSNTLNQAGIPGIQYLDQFSRAVGEGSRNYVMFDPSLVKIMRKYAVPGAIGGAATGAALSQSQSNPLQDLTRPMTQDQYNQYLAAGNT